MGIKEENCKKINLGSSNTSNYQASESLVFNGRLSALHIQRLLN